MRYLLRAQVIGAVPEIELSEAEYLSLESAHQRLTAGGALEEKFEILLSNYLDLEKAILNLSADQMVRGEISYERMFEARMTLNRMLINLLTTARLYVDHLPHHANEILGKARQDDVVGLLKKEYDSDFRYRFMEALRNYVQHRGFPAHGISFPGRRIEHKRRDFVFSLEFSSLKARLIDDGKFKQAVLDEAPEQIDLKACARYYLERLSVVHKSVRDMTAPLIDASRGEVGRAMQRYEEAYKRKPIGLAAVRQDDGGKAESAVPLLLDWENIRQDLVKRNNELVNLRDRCVSSAIHAP